MIVTDSQDLVYDRKFDNSLKATCKGCAVAEAVFEHEHVSSAWNKILGLLKDEEIERKTAQGLMAEKEEGAGEPCDRRRGRSRERRSSGRDRRRRDEEERGEDKRRPEKKTRRGETAVILTPASPSRERDSGAKRGVIEVSLSESAESEEESEEDESVEPAPSRAAAAELKGPAEEKEAAAHKPDPPPEPMTSRFSGSEPPPEPKHPPKGKPGPRTQPKGKVGNDADKCSSYKCEICKRTVGGGEAGSYQHCRSQYHLASWVWHQNRQSRPWSDCQRDGDSWSRMLWKKGNTGPREWPEGHPQKKQQKQRLPPPIRASDKTKYPDQGPDHGGPDDSAASSSARNNLLLQMWVTAVREA